MGYQFRRAIAGGKNGTAWVVVFIDFGLEINSRGSMCSNDEVDGGKGKTEGKTSSWKVDALLVGNSMI